jgi:hypothetical protein
MRVGLETSNLVAIANNRRASPAAGGTSLTQLANTGAATRMGVRPGSLPGSYQPVYEVKEKRITEAVTETRDITRSEAVYEDRAVTETRAVYADRAVYEDRDIRTTVVEGDRSISGARSLAQAGIDVGADLSVRVGDGATATIEFESKSRITVKVGSKTARFDFDAKPGAFTDAVVAAFNSIEGLSASLTPEGRLKLETRDAQTLRIADVANGWFDWSGSPLDALGLDAGTTRSQVVGSERVQVGTERVQVGTETIITGSTRVQIGERQVVVGQETVVTGTTTRTEPGQRVLVGLQDSTAPGVGSLSLLDKLKGGGLPAGYVEALFGILESHESEPSESEVRAVYAETTDDAEKTSGKSVAKGEASSDKAPGATNLA